MNPKIMTVEENFVWITTGTSLMSADSTVVLPLVHLVLVKILFIGEKPEHPGGLVLPGGSVLPPLLEKSPL